MIKNLQQDLLLVRRGLISFASVMMALQWIVEFSLENILINGQAFAAFALACFAILRPINRYAGAPLTAAAVLMAVSANSIVPMLGTLLEGHSLTYTLKSPVETYAHRLLFAFSIIGAHHFALRSSWAKSPLGRILKRIHVRDLIPPEKLWIVGGIGFLTLFLRWSIGGVLPVPVLKFLEGCNFLPYAIFILLVPPYLSRTMRRPLWVLGILLAYIAFVAVGVTSRMALVGPIAAIAFGWLVALLAGYAHVNLRLLKRGLIALPLILLVMGQFNDFSDAILIERAYRNERSWGENLSATWSTFRDKEKLDRHTLAKEKNAQSENRIVWRENYIRNPFLSRFTTIKFDDNILRDLDRLSSESIRKIRQVTWQKIVALVPSPALSFIHPGFNKEEVNSFSMGDFIALQQGSATHTSFLTGSMVAHSYIFFGWAYPFALFGLYSVLFILYQTGGAGVACSKQVAMPISTFALLLPFQLFLSLNFEGWHLIAGGLLRGFWQLILIYGTSCFFVGLLFRTDSEIGCSEKT